MTGDPRALVDTEPAFAARDTRSWNVVAKVRVKGERTAMGLTPDLNPATCCEVVRLEVHQ